MYICIYIYIYKGAHDHEPAVRIIAADDGSRRTTIVKAGLHHNLCAVTDLVWGSAGGQPEVRVEKVRLDDYYGNEEMETLISKHQVPICALMCALICALMCALMCALVCALVCALMCVLMSIEVTELTRG
jgi:hypothetical protein